MRYGEKGGCRSRLGFNETAMVSDSTGRERLVCFDPILGLWYEKKASAKERGEDLGEGGGERPCARSPRR